MSAAILAEGGLPDFDRATILKIIAAARDDLEMDLRYRYYYQRNPRTIARAVFLRLKRALDDLAKTGLVVEKQELQDKFTSAVEHLYENDEECRPLCLLMGVRQLVGKYDLFRRGWEANAIKVVIAAKNSSDAKVKNNWAAPQSVLL